jgi:hypothetical protein
MAYKEKQSLITILIYILGIGSYLGYILTRDPEQYNDSKFWASTMLIFIGILIVMTIIILIAFHIAYEVIYTVKNEKDQIDDVVDEMEKLISLKSIRNGGIVSSVTILFAPVLVLFDVSLIWVLNVVYIGFFVAAIFEECSKLYFYRRGIRNG